MTTLPQQATAHCAAAALALLVTLGTLVTLDTLAQGAPAATDAGTLVQAQPAAARG
jgi:hypothetical protein